MKLLYNEEEFVCAKTELLNFRFTLPLAKLDMIVARLVSNGLIFSGDDPVDIQLVTFLLLSDVKELSIGAKTKKVANHHLLENSFYLTKNIPFC